MKLKSIVKWITIVGACIIITLGILYWEYVVGMYQLFNNPFNDRNFHQATWLAIHESNDPDNPRGKMVYDLQDNHLKKALTKKDVLLMLGEPDFQEGTDFLMYVIGMWTGFRIDYDTLDVYFNETGYYSHSRITQH